MKNAILIHGITDEEEYFSDKYPSLSNSHWLPWLQKQLLIKGIQTQTPEMPNGIQPIYEEWKNLFERFEINEETILVGHSCGGGFLVRWLSENKIKVGKVALVAPWLDPENELDNKFFDFQIDKNLVDKVKSIRIFISNDSKDVLDSVSMIKNSIDLEIEQIDSMGHFTLSSMGKEEFPELVNFLI